MAKKGGAKINPLDGPPEDLDLRDITPAEETELLRVFGTLADLHERTRLETYLQANPGKFKEVDMKLETLGRKPIEQKSIGPLDVDLMLKRLGRRSNKRYIWDTIWECDENLDGRIDWDEMKLCFQRNASDETGLEHSKFYNLIQFMMFDANDNGAASIDETMEFLHARYGRAGLEMKLKVLFGPGMVEQGTEGGEIDFLTFLDAVNRAQLDTFVNSEQGQALEAIKKSTKK